MQPLLMRCSEIVPDTARHYIRVVTSFGALMALIASKAMSTAGADPGFWKGEGGCEVWVINWQCAHRRCAPQGGGSEGMPPRNF